LVGNKIYIFGGRCHEDYNWHYYNDLWSFDTETWTWERISPKGNPPEARCKHAAAAVGRDIFIYGGYAYRSAKAQYLDDVYRYDTVANRWFKCLPTGISPPGRWQHTISVIDNTLYIFGGYLKVSSAHNQEWEDSFPNSLYILDVKQNPGPNENKQEEEVTEPAPEIEIAGPPPESSARGVYKDPETLFNDPQFCTNYADYIRIGSFHAFYNKPAVLGLMPDVTDKNIVDAGCGPGECINWFLRHRARHVTAVDNSPIMLKYVEDQFKDRENLDIVKADLRKPLTFAGDEQFDVILCSLVLDYIEHWYNTFREFNRVLKLGGVLIFSVPHPYAAFHESGENNYFKTEFYSSVWRIKKKHYGVPIYRRSFEDIFDTLENTKFKLDKFVEPKPVLACKDKYPEEFQLLSSKPCFVCFRAIKTGSFDVGGNESKNTTGANTDT